ncbi:MAG: hypothetical protein HFE65_02390 [Clostridiales bacterium]|nr:hypothetical protein [Clostridiales bacterium]
MTNSKNTKRALLTSVLSMMLCLAMLIGSTFAWFTDSVISGKNRIVAGNLDVELYAKNGPDYTPVTADTNLFLKDTLWEPGHVEVVNLKVANLGTLALQYKFGINVAAEKSGTNVAGETFKLSDSIQFALINEEKTFAEGDEGRAAAIAAAEAAGSVALSALAVDEDGVLYPKNTEGKASESFVTLVVYMPTNVENEANYLTGTEAPEIDLGVTLVATQTPYENDSFNDQYDKNAAYPAIESSDAWYTSVQDGNYTIKNGNELAYLAKLVNAGTDNFTGKTITLSEDIILPTGEWVAIGTSDNPFMGTFDGAGYTVSNIEIHDNDGTETNGFFGAISRATIQNLTVRGIMTLGGVQGDNNDVFTSGNGGICAYAENSHILGCTNAIDIDATGRYTTIDTPLLVGGVVGLCQGVTIENCKNEGAITVPDNTIAGGITSIIGTWSGRWTVDKMTGSDENSGTVSCCVPDAENSMVGPVYGLDTEAEY